MFETGEFYKLYECSGMGFIAAVAAEDVIHLLVLQSVSPKNSSVFS